MESEARTRHTALQVMQGITRIGGHIAREAFVRPRATSAADVPVTGRESTVDWLAAVLGDSYPGAAVETFDTETVSTGTSTRWKLGVTYNESGRVAGLPENLFAKTTTDCKQRLTLAAAAVLGLDAAKAVEEVR